MPQIVLEYTNNIDLELDYNRLFSEIHKIIHKHAGIKIENCKSRVIKLDKYYIGDGKKQNAFIHLEIKILEGRSYQIKSELGNFVLKLLEKHFSEEKKDFDLQITIELIDIEKNSYFKFPSGSLKY